MAASIESIISEMRGMSDFLTTYQTSLSTRPEELDATKSAMMRSVIAKIHMIANLDFAGGARITEAVSALANDDIIDSGMRDLITSALIQKMQGQPIVTTHARKEPQACMRADRYLVEEDWVLLESTENIQARLGHIRDAMHKVGLTNPSELNCYVQQLKRFAPFFSSSKKGCSRRGRLLTFIKVSPECELETYFIDKIGSTLAF